MENIFIRYINGEPFKLEIEDLHNSKECMRLLNTALNAHRKLYIKLMVAYYHNHNNYCESSLKFIGHGW